MAEAIEALSALMDSKAFGLMAVLVLAAWERHREELRHREAMHRKEEALDQLPKTPRAPGAP